MANQSNRVGKTIVLTAMALIAFAANSVLCRLALGEAAIDAGSFTSIRLLSGALTLLVILFYKKEKPYLPRTGSWQPGLMLFIYAIAFSFAYITLDTGTGALILFGAVQITMIIVSLFRGNRLHASEWFGIVIAFSGFVYLILPGVSTPSVFGFSLMTIAGIAWGLYTLKGKDSTNPLLDTAHNFMRTIPLVIIIVLLTLKNGHFSLEGFILAALSGSIASGLGYTIWYKALEGLSATQAAVIQLSVPMIAALGGVMFVSEPITLRLTISGILILGGILTVVLGRTYFVQTEINP
ncbi:DMT family transporter [bacterium]|nr:DMT family transporter [bacterium]